MLLRVRYGGDLDDFRNLAPPYPSFYGMKPGAYVNGAIAPFVAGELALGAFESGEERYGVDILKRMGRKISRDGKVAFLYNWQGEQDYVKLMHISVHPDYRKQGLGERLMTHAQQEMKELGMGRFRGETRASNLPMQRLFEKMGYRLDRVEENYYHNPEESAYKYLLQF